jgi:predicted alpha/beta superfamily hydrolase
MDFKMTEGTLRVGILQTENRKLFSRLVGIEYQLAVWLPETYASSGKHYPVIYVLDGDLFFGMATTLIPLMSWIDRVPEMIIVGIGYNRSMAEWGLLREKDFKIPEVQDDPPDSHADRFLAALKQELIPFIDANYRTDPQERTLYGYSSSGFFTVYTLVNEPDLFRNYLAGSPDTDLSCPYLLAHDQKLVYHESKTPIDLFLTIGDLEDGTFQSSLVKFNELTAAIQTRSYPGLRLMTQIYVGENHGAGGSALTFIHGLRQCCSNANL